MHPHVSGESGDITRRLNHWSTGDRDAENELFDVVFPTLRRLAQYLMMRERDQHTLEPAELVNQIYFRLAAAKNRRWQNRQHFFALAARAMRQYLIDRARTRRNKEFISLEDTGDTIATGFTDLELLLTVNWLLNQLAKANPEWHKLLALKYSLGLNDQETAQAMRIRLRTMQRMCSDARRWLSERAGVVTPPLHSRRKGKTAPNASY
jgi:RNA polymerase sigma factor (TIGR02999 family)